MSKNVTPELILHDNLHRQPAAQTDTTGSQAVTKMTEKNMFLTFIQ